MSLPETIPLTLYIHMPWCIRKCPYCDFNSHTLPQDSPEEKYIEILIQDLEQDMPLIWGRRIHSIFIGGGTPSLISAHGYEKLLSAIRARLTLLPSAEITLEANPGTFEQQRFHDYYNLGINRLSIGIQSFNSHHLAALGRIHNDQEALKAVDIAYQAGFTNLNLDLMYGLPHQSLQQVLEDLQTACALSPPHLSWYQLTLEPNTVFHKHPPPLPDHDLLFEFQQAGHALLIQHGYSHYEVSAYAKPDYRCQHNRNYWQFGDYLGIGAGAHSKITCQQTGMVNRFIKKKLPTAYMKSSSSFIAEKNAVPPELLPFEFMLNALRLQEKISTALFCHRTGLSLSNIIPSLKEAKAKQLLNWNEEFITLTPLGQRFLNDVTTLFLPS